jgi:uncharacterized protein (TIGR03083 family)
MDTFSLVADERRRLADALTEFTADEWVSPSLCAGWTVHQVAAHLNVPFEVKTLSFALGMLKARGNFDVANQRFAVELAERMDPAACIEGLRRNAEHRFTPPGFGPEAPLTDVVVHGCDLLQPVGRSLAVGPDALRVVLPFVVGRAGTRGFGAAKVDDLRFVATDVDQTAGGAGPTVEGPARSLVAAVLGRTPFMADLSGPGAEVLAQRL